MQCRLQLNHLNKMAVTRGMMSYLKSTVYPLFYKFTYISDIYYNKYHNSPKKSSERKLLRITQQVSDRCSIQTHLSLRLGGTGTYAYTWALKPGTGDMKFIPLKFHFKFHLILNYYCSLP